MSRTAAVLLALFFVACAGGSSVSTTPVPAASAPSTRAIPGPLPPAPDVSADTVKGEPPRNWQLLDQEQDHIAGVSSERAMKELLAGKAPKRTVVVAVIDGGVDTAHVDLRANLWQNPREAAQNRKDDDGNGYVDDVRGWNFIGGRDGKDVNQDSFEATRVYAGCQHRAPGGDFSVLPPGDQATCKRAAAEYEKALNDMKSALPNIQQADRVLKAITAVLKTALHSDSVTDEGVAKLKPTSDDVSRAKTVYMQITAQGITRAEIDKSLAEVNNRLNYGLDLKFNPRTIVGDDTMNVNERGYGNSDVTGPDASHGTHVAGIIGAVRGNGIGIDGIAPAVRIMVVRAVPDGDERDKDIANAIRYAADNGANVINMSFGKGLSPHKDAVDAAVKYADSKGVLLVHAAGNDGADNDSTESYPNARYIGGGRPANWIEVGATSWKGGAELPASFSNYGAAQVDLFAPGVDILSTVPGSKYERDSGTSMASPVVCGVAALVMAYYPELTAQDVKRILLNSAARHPAQMVTKPGDDKGGLVPFGSLSATGGIVNAYNALKMAAQVVGR